MGRRRDRLDQRLENQAATRKKNSRRKSKERARRAVRLEAKASRATAAE